MRYYTIGEIYRLGLLKSHSGKPYMDKATVSRIVRSANYQNIDTPFGPGKRISKKEIDRINKRNQRYSEKDLLEMDQMAKESVAALRRATRHSE